MKITAVSDARKQVEKQLGTLDRALKNRVERKMKEEEMEIPEVIYIHKSKRELTGRISSRRRWWSSKIIITIEVKMTHTFCGEDLSDVVMSKLHWEDARWEDFISLKGKWKFV